jgi:hypothetical protein
MVAAEIYAGKIFRPVNNAGRVAGEAIADEKAIRSAGVGIVSAWWGDKAEYLDDKHNPRFVVASLPAKVGRGTVLCSRQRTALFAQILTQRCRKDPTFS